MSDDTDLWFAEECTGPFRFLVERYGFRGPFASRAGNEFTVRYSKKKKTISIVIAPGDRPFVEFFSPSVDIAHRKFPRFQPLPPLKKKSEEEILSSDLLHWAMELETQNRDFLSDEGQTKGSCFTFYLDGLWKSKR
jgi:hypothetical protein